MMRKNKAHPVSKETSLAKTPSYPFGWIEEMDRWFDDLCRTFEDRFWGGPLERLSDAGLRVRGPLVDLMDQGEAFVVRAELPGVSKDDVDLNVTQDGLEIRAEARGSREEKEKNFFYQERTYQALQRVLRFPEEVKSDLASATLKDGLLEVRLPKKEPTLVSKPVKVPVE